MFLAQIVDIGPTINLDPHEENGTLGQALLSSQAVYVSMDLRNKAQVLKGVEVVFHMAAPNSSMNDYHLHYSVNVEGTKNVIDACIELKVKRLIYTSSPGFHGVLDADESVPYMAKDKKGAMKVLGEWSDCMGLWAMPAYVGVHTLTLALCLPYTVFMEATASLIFGFFHLNGLERSPHEGQLKGGLFGLCVSTKGCNFNLLSG
nr:isoform 2 of 3beta-hydroxysteroid-dehydrogenase/decarboxylase isoform 1 [Quercus suber]